MARGRPPSTRARVRTSAVDGRAIHVVDDWLPERVLEESSRRLCALPLRKAEPDLAGTEMRGLVADLPLHALGKDALVTAILRQVDRHFPGEPFRVARAYCNGNVYGDMAHPHSDAPRDRPRDVTALLYANLRWEPEWGGETIFYDRTKDAVVCVAPRPGRLALFRGTIAHRNGVPSRECYELRLTFVLKLAAV